MKKHPERATLDADRPLHTDAESAVRPARETVSARATPMQPDFFASASPLPVGPAATALSSPTPLLITTTTTIAAGQVYDFTGSTGIEVSYTFPNPMPSFYNHGLITVSNATSFATGIAVKDSFPSDAVIVNESDGVIRVSATQMPVLGNTPGEFAYGITNGGAGSPDVYNYGLIEVSATFYAQGYTSAGSSDALFLNAGALKVTARVDAFGVAGYTSDFHNTGVVEVTGRLAIGYDAYAKGFVNDGAIRAFSSTGDSYGILSDWAFDGGTYVNNGLIEGAYAFYSLRNDVGPSPFLAETIINTGEMLGVVNLDLGNDVVLNSGLMVGAIAMGEHRDIYVGINGRQFGGVYGGAGDDVLLGGASADELHGFEGVDVLTGGGGDDVIEGGRGSDFMDGGAGYDLVTFEANTSGVTFDMTTGVATSADRDRATNFEAAIGSAFRDIITGTGAANFIEGGAGNDTLQGGGGNDTLVGDTGADELTGGAGADVFVFYKGDGADTVTDFQSGDQLSLHGFATYQQLLQVGADTRVVLSGTDSILLKNVQVSSIGGSAFLFDGAPVGEFPSGPEPLDTMFVNVDTWVKAGEELRFLHMAVYFEMPGTFPTIQVTDSFFNEGHIIVEPLAGDAVTFRAFQTRSLGGPGANPPASTFYNGATGVIEVTGHDSYAVYGYDAEAFGHVFVNAGAFTVRAEAGQAYGIYTEFFAMAVVNSGTVTVSGAMTGSVPLAAYGVFAGDGAVWNSGSILVSGPGAFTLGVAASDLVNSGLIRVQDGTAGTLDNVAVNLIGKGFPQAFHNSGIVEGDYAVKGSGSAGDLLTIYNSGELRGLVDLGAMRYVIYNSGLITKALNMGATSDIYDGRAGTLNGGISGGGGNDLILAGLGADTVSGGDGDDTLGGGAGADTLTGGAGADIFRFEQGAGADQITDFVAGTDKIVVSGYANYQSVVQQGANTKVTFSGSDSILLLNVQASTISAANFQFSAPVIAAPTIPTAPSAPVPPFLPTEQGAPAAPLFGTDAADRLTGGDGADVISGGAGDDVIDGGKGSDILLGGGGRDIFTSGIENGSDIIYEFNVLQDSLRLDVENGYFLERAGDDVLVYGGGNGSTIRVQGVDVAALTQVTFRGQTGAGAIDQLTGFDNLQDWLNGEGGADQLSGLGGDDRLEGGLGDDFLDGGNGDDTAEYRGATAGVTVNLSLTNAQNTVAAGLDTLVSIENLTGSAFNDTLTGDGAANRFIGGLGADILTGGGGADRFWFNAGDGEDVITDFSAGADKLVVSGYSTYSLTQVGADLKVVFDGTNSILLKNLLASAFTNTNINIARLLTLNGTGAGETLSGTENPETINGLGGADVLKGWDGNDFLYGGDGDDLLYGGNGADLMDGGAGVDTVDYRSAIAGVRADLGITGIQQTAAAGGDTLVGIENILGSAFNDELWGASGANRLEGGAGDDWLAGGLGVDTFLTGSGADTLYFVAGDGADVVLDFTTGEAGDRILFDGYQSYTLQQIGADLKVVFSGGDSILLANVQASAFTAYNLMNVDVTLFAGDLFGNDITGTAGDDYIQGFELDDYLIGGAGNDILSGGDDPDNLTGGAGNDYLDGGGGIDTAYYENETGAFTLDLAAGWATIGSDHDTLVGVEIVHGVTAFVNIMTGDGADNWLSGGNLNDTIAGGAGGDTLIGGGGDDVITGGLGADSLQGWDGSDTFVFAAGDGKDTISDFNAGTGHDHIVVTGYTGYDIFQEGANLRIVFDADNSILLLAGAGRFSASDINILSNLNLMTGTSAGESLTGTSNRDQIDGLGGNDTLRGANGDDILNGGDGDDILEGGNDNDQLNGGLGIDKADYRNAISGVTVNLSITTAQNTGSAGIDTLNGMEQVLGSAYIDTLTGDAGANTLDGKNGNDVLKGGSGGDILIGGAGADALDGGGDLDYASYINATAAVGINLTTGVHTGEAAGDTFVNIERYRLSANNDSFVGSAGTDYAYGAEGNDTLSGAGGIDRLYGQDGNDTLNGDAGNDILLGGAGADIFNGGADRDTASYEESSIALTINMTTGVHTGDATGDTFNSVEILWLSKFADTYTGSAGDDEVRGYDGNDTLNGSGGIDTLRGENGADILNGDDGDDLLNGGLGADALHGGNGVDTAVYLLATAGVSINLTTGVHTGEAAGDTFNSVEHFQLTNGFTLVDTFTGSAGADWVAGYKGVDNLFGMDGNDTLNGGEHNDVLDGGAGADKLYGGAGNDQETGGTGADQFIVNAKAFGADTVTDFENGVDKIRVQNVAGWDDFSDVAVSSNGSGWAVITFNDGSTITLTGTAASDVDASDFLWI